MGKWLDAKLGVLSGWGLPLVILFIAVAVQCIMALAAVLRLFGQLMPQVKFLLIVTLGSELFRSFG